VIAQSLQLMILYLYLIWEIGKKKIKSLSITFSKNLAEDERKKLQTLFLELETEEDGVDVDENKVKDVKKNIIMLENKKKKGIFYILHQ
jgi:ABC-type phosphate/phosphonate transport system substrate-binding protein